MEEIENRSTCHIDCAAVISTSRGKGKQVTGWHFLLCSGDGYIQYVRLKCRKSKQRGFTIEECSDQKTNSNWIVVETLTRREAPVEFC